MRLFLASILQIINNQIQEALPFVMILRTAGFLLSLMNSGKCHYIIGLLIVKRN